MRVQSFHASSDRACGIALFSNHLKAALVAYDIQIEECGLAGAATVRKGPARLLHYVPSSFASPRSSASLIRFLRGQDSDENLSVILHGLFRPGETRFRLDSIASEQETHIRLILEKATSIVCLSPAVEQATRAWQSYLQTPASMIQLDHPGLFAAAGVGDVQHRYVLVGGIGRAKKDPGAAATRDLITHCEASGVRVWQHWTNRSSMDPIARSWRHSYGVLSDNAWSAMVSGAHVVMCPYDTRVQSVSGVISEALSAGRFVLATGFEIACEMNRRDPSAVRIENELSRWPGILNELCSVRPRVSTRIPTWSEFGAGLSDLLKSARPANYGYLPDDRRPAFASPGDAHGRDAVWCRARAGMPALQAQASHRPMGPALSGLPNDH